jgi:putative ABC transport system ATP-binding protein
VSKGVGPQVDGVRTLELEAVVKHFRGVAEEVRAVDGVSLTIEQGEMVSLQGPSGSGKTTLLLLMAALLRAEAGAVSYAGRDLASLSEPEVSRFLMYEVGFIFQRFHLWSHSSVIRNASQKLISSGAGVRDARERVVPWLERVGLGERLGYAAGRLSGGERQRVAIARVLACEPRLILADEPTGNLDSARSKEIVELLRSISHDRGAMVVLVTHDADVAALADRHYTLRDGVLKGGEPSGGTLRSSAPQG